MSLLRSICCMFGGRCAEEEPKPSTETMRREAPGDLGQRDAERERASEATSTHGDRPSWNSQARFPTRLLNFSSTCRLVNFPFECTQRGAEPLLRDIPIHNLLAKD
jgi:hypothetical protein